MTLSILIAAGGTGGHMIPAHALAEELQRRGHSTTLLTDARGLRFPGLFEGCARHVVDSATASGLHPVKWLQAGFAIRRGRKLAIEIARDCAASAVVGFGGYPSLPGLLAGISLRLRCIIHEQNAILGRVNRRLQRQVTAIALSYRDTDGIVPAAEYKTAYTGNPVRQAILATRDKPFRAPDMDSEFNLLVVGGSQGARIMSKLLPTAIAALSERDRRRLRVVQQCRAEDLSATSLAYKDASVQAECFPYLVDLPARLAAAHLVVSRAGASTMAELTAAGRAAILLPYAAATNDHQAANAREFVRAGAGFLLREREARQSRMTGLLQGFLHSPEALHQAAVAARALGVPDAAVRLADLIEQEVRGA